MSNITPSRHFIEIIKILKKNNRQIRIAEIGVDKGATTKKCIELLDKNDTYDLFDIYDCHFFSENYLKNTCNINIFPNSRKIYDSYSWSIAMIYLQNKKKPQIYDAVYIDGAHTFPVDAPATCCLKEMIICGGYLIFDDMQWTLSSSPTCNTVSMRNRFTDEQMDAKHVEMIVNIFMRSDRRFIEVTKPGECRAVFQRV